MKELTLGEIQQGSFQILKKIKAICDQNNLSYFLDYGTLIGAVRHQGFIPWDDDIDIAMPRKDYEKLINLYLNNKAIFAPYELMHFKTNKKYIYPIARLSDPAYSIKYSNAKDYGLGLFVDIYPLDGVNLKDKKQIKKLNHLCSLIYVAGNKHMSKARNILRNIPKLICFVWSRFLDINKLLKKNDKLAQKYDYDKCDDIGCIAIEPWINFKKSLFSETILMKFEDSKFNVPKAYDQRLKEYYGDYMKLPPENERIGHHNYSCTKK